MHIKGMTVGLRSHPAFDNDIDFDFDKRVNLFIGPNACGKTSLLRVLATAGNAERSSMIPFNTDIRISDDWEKMRGEPNDFDPGFLSPFSEVPWIYIPATRIIVPGILDWDSADLPFNDAQLLEKDTFGEICERISWQEDAYTFDSRWVAGLVKVIFDSHKTKDYPLAGEYLKMVRLAYTCAKKISSEVIAGRPGNYVAEPAEYIILGPEETEPLLLEPTVHPAMGVTVNAGKKFQQTYAGDLSAGTQGIYFVVLYLTLRMICHYKFANGWEKQPAILLIDEIENHLHPTWQRRVIPVLLEHFPGLQIFATTHSPFVVAGLKAGQVHLLNRDDDGVITASTNDRDIIGWTTDQVLRTFMGVDEPTDQLTVDRSKRLRELYGKSSLTADDETELNELRGAVSADFPQDPVDPRLNAQRERYADLMQQFLRSRLSEPAPDNEAA